VKKRIGLVRVLTTSDKDFLNLHGNLIEKAYPWLEVDSRCIPDHPEGVHNEETERSATPLVVRLAKDFEDEGYDAVVVSCAGDPGVREAREVLKIPVVGAGEASAGIALTLGERIGVLGITSYVPARMKAVLGPALVCSVKPSGVETTVDLMRENGREAVQRSAEELKARGVQVIVLACTGLSTIGAAQWIAEKAGLKVVDPVDAAGLVALYVTTRQFRCLDTI